MLRGLVGRRKVQKDNDRRLRRHLSPIARSRVDIPKVPGLDAARRAEVYARIYVLRLSFKRLSMTDDPHT